MAQQGLNYLVPLVVDSTQMVVTVVQTAALPSAVKLTSTGVLVVTENAAIQITHAVDTAVVAVAKSVDQAVAVATRVALQMDVGVLGVPTVVVAEAST